jgi:hypothetical protein
VNDDDDDDDDNKIVETKKCRQIGLVFRHSQSITKYVAERILVYDHRTTGKNSVFTYRDPRPPKGRSKILTGGRLMMVVNYSYNSTNDDTRCYE